MSSRTFKKDRTEDLVHLGINYFARHYSNSKRNNCPPQAVLRNVVQSGKLPGNEIWEHLFTCSECFNDYREELARHHEMGIQGGSY
jgi:hypothetical protein